MIAESFSKHARSRCWLRLVPLCAVIFMACTSAAEYVDTETTTFGNLRVENLKLWTQEGLYRFISGTTRPVSLDIAGDVRISNYLGISRDNSYAFNDIDSIYGICIGSFAGCSNITSIVISNGDRSPWDNYCYDRFGRFVLDITNVVDEAFKNCTSLQSFSASGVPRFGANVFAGDTNLLSVTLLGAPPKGVLASGVLANFPTNFVYSPEYAEEWAPIISENASRLNVEYVPSEGRTITDKEETELKIHCNYPHAKIYYTTDGSDPTASSLEYQGSIVVSGRSGNAVSIKAVAIVDGWPTDPATIKSITFPVQKTPDNDCITFTCKGCFTLKTGNNKKNWDVGMQWSVNKIDWVEWNGEEIAAAQIGGAGAYNLYVRGDENTTVTGGHYAKWVLTQANNYKIECLGNIETLRGATRDAPSDTKMAIWCYFYMFNGCKLLAKAPKLPATMLSNGCYLGMFEDCASLEEAPKLPAMTLADHCYAEMFYHCVSLTAAPELPATNLAVGCYLQMFQGCEVLKTAPELPATNLADSCYCLMFSGCESLQTAPELPATTLVDSCYFGMFASCISLTSPPRLTAVNLAYGCYAEMFSWCWSLKTTPALPAMTLTDSCYEEMFSDCVSLTAAPDLPATILKDLCYFRMFRNCSNLVVSVNAVGRPWSIPSGATTAIGWNTEMFDNTGGDFTGDPAVGVTYYIGSKELMPEPPVIKPASGTTFDTSLTVSMTCASENATIYYTTDGSVPTMASMAYTSKFKIYGRTTVKAIAFYEDGTTSEMTVAEYANGRCETPSITPPNGSTFEHSGQIVTLAHENPEGTLRYTMDGSDPVETSSVYAGPFTIDETTTIKAKVFGEQYLDSGIVTATLTRVWLKVAKPVITAPAIFTGSKAKVVISCATEGATVRYTTDGSEPNSHDAKYTKPFFVTESTTVKAKATKADYTASDTATRVIVREWGIGDTMGKPDHSFETSGNDEFVRVEDETATLGESMRSGYIEDNQTSVLTTTVVGPGTLTFKWKTSCETTEEHDWDHAEFAVDGKKPAQILDGITDWIEVSQRINGEGEHVVTWTYIKDDVEGQGEDCLWVSDYAWASDYTTTQTTDVPVPYAWLTEKCRDVVDEYESYESVASQAAYNPKYTVEQCYVAGLDPESKTNEFSACITMVDGVPNVTWSPDKKAERVYKIWGSMNLVNGGDWECPTNSLHRFFKVTVEMPTIE